MSNNKAQPAAALRVSGITAENRQKIAASVKQLWQDPEYRARQTAARRRLWQNPEYRAMQTAARRRLWQNPEYRARQVATVKKRWQNPEFRARQVREIKAETRQKQAAASKRRWLDPEYRARQMAAIIKGKQISCQHREKMAEVGPAPLSPDQAKAPPPAKSQKARGPALAGARPPASLPRPLPLESELGHRSMTHHAYLKSAVWQCPQSPGGAHHWIINGEKMKCKHCQQERGVKQCSYVEPL